MGTSEVLILAKTRMKKNTCIGGVLANGRFVRLLTKFGKNQSVDCPLNIGDIYDIKFQTRQDVSAPHTEDILVSNLKLKNTYKTNLAIIKHLQDLNVKIWHGGLDAIFFNQLKWTSGGKGYISQPEVPALSVGFWMANKDLHRETNNGKNEYIYSQEPRRSITYVGQQKALDVIPAGTIIRLSLARWWSPNVGFEKRCYLQLSGCYIPELAIQKTEITSLEDVQINLNPFNPIVDDEKSRLVAEKLNGKTFIGIDFGTSSTVVSMACYDMKKRCIKTKVIPIKQKLADDAIFEADIIPTMIAWHNQKLLIGEGANIIRLKKIKNRNIWYGFKMDLGGKDDFLYKKSELSGAGVQLLNAKDATSLFFNYLYQEIHTYIQNNNLPEDIEYSISVPASFEPNQRQDLMSALDENDFQFNEQAFIDEPNAAYLSYIISKKSQRRASLADKYNANLLVFDYGAGTCDVSILNITLDANKLFSKNIAISKFNHAGGKEIDRVIASEILLPQLFKSNDIGRDYFTPREIDMHILPDLERFAEILKIETCKSIALQESRIDYSNHHQQFSLNSTAVIKTKKGVYKLKKPTISFNEFSQIMELFTSISSKSQCQKNINERAYSIYRPIRTALKKANLNRKEINYVLLMGGSAKNPLIQKSIKNFFADSKHLIPNNLQAHVAAGAAINSLLYNGLKQQVIMPISNEEIYLMTQKNELEVPHIIFAAGVQLPTSEVLIKHLLTTNETDMIELPICISGGKNVLFNIVIKGKKFAKKTEIELLIQLDVDRNIHCCAIANGVIVHAKIGGSSLESGEMDIPRAAIERAEHYDIKNLVTITKGE